MKTKTQFLPLLKFELSSVFFMAWFLCAMILFCTGFLTETRSGPTYGITTFNSGLQIWVFFSIAIWIFFPQGTVTGRSSGLAWQTDHSEFMLTRAIERKNLARAKTATCWIVVSLPLLVGLGLSFRHPDLALYTYSSGRLGGVAQETYVTEFFGSHLKTMGSSPSDEFLVIPRGQIFQSMWDLWQGLFGVILSQGVCGCVMNTRFSKKILEGIYVVFFLWMFLMPSFLSKPLKLFPSGEQVFFFFHSHMLLLFLGTLALGVGTHLLYERQFQKMEVV